MAAKRRSSYAISLILCSAVFATGCTGPVERPPKSEAFHKIQLTDLPELKLIELPDKPFAVEAYTPEGVEVSGFDEAGMETWMSYVVAARANTAVLEQAIIGIDQIGQERTMLVLAGRAREDQLNFMVDRYYDRSDEVVELRNDLTVQKALNYFSIAVTAVLGMVF